MTLQTGERLPDLTLARAGEDGQVALRPRGRKGIVVVLLHGPGCPACRDYVARLGALAADIEEWDGRIVLVSTDEPPPDTSPTFDAPPAFLQARDEQNTLVQRSGTSAPAVLIADQWGELFAVGGADPDHNFVIQPEEVVEWLRFLAIKCPECEGEAL